MQNPGLVLREWEARLNWPVWITWTFLEVVGNDHGYSFRIVLNSLPVGAEVSGYGSLRPSRFLWQQVFLYCLHNLLSFGLYQLALSQLPPWFLEWWWASAYKPYLVVVVCSQPITFLSLGGWWLCSYVCYISNDSLELSKAVIKIPKKLLTSLDYPIMMGG